MMIATEFERDWLLELSLSRLWAVSLLAKSLAEIFAEVLTEILAEVPREDSRESVSAANEKRKWG